MPKTIHSQTKQYDARNVESARLIAADPVKYPGVMQAWAQLILQRNGQTLPKPEER